MAYDDVLLRMKQFGPYQRRIYVLLYLPIIVNALNKFGVVFLNAKMDFRCLLPFENSENATYVLNSDIMNANYPWNYKSQKWSSCHRLHIELPYNSTTKNRFILPNDRQNYQDSTNNSNVIRCESYVYDKSMYQSTTTSEWNLVCDKSWLRATGDALFMSGVMIGSLTFGGLSDKYGRRPTFLICTVLQLVSGVAVAIAPEYISHVISRVLLGSSLTGQFLVIYVLVMEIVGPEKRLLAGLGCQLAITIGYIMSAGIAYYITSWRALQFVFIIPGVAFLSYWWFIPESARWLLSKGREQEARQLLQHASKENGVEISDSMLDTLLGSDSEKSISDDRKSSIMDLLRYPNLRRKSILIFFNWFVNCLTYYGLSWNSPNLGGNQYVNYVISGAVEIPAYIFLVFTLDRWGRKLILSGSLIVSSIVLLATIFVPSDSTWLLITLSMIGKLAITSSYSTIYIFTTEQFPTVIRNVGLGASSTSARIGGIIVPYVNQLSEVWVPFPLVIFGSLTFICGMTTLLLPETLNKKLPETIQDMELFGLKTSKSNIDLKTDQQKLTSLLQQNKDI